MRHAARKSFHAIATAILVSAIGSPAFAQVLSEFQLPAGMAPTDIDSDSMTGDIYFLDPPTGTINLLSGGVVQQWPSLPCTLTNIDKIAVSNVLLNPAVYFTSIATNSICILDPSTNSLSWYVLPFVVNSPRTLSIDSVGKAWFSSTPAAGPASVASLDPITNNIHLWVLPGAVAAPGDTIDGLQFASGWLYFSVTGIQNQICVILTPGANPSATNCYPMPFTQPAPIRVNPANQVYRIAGAGFNRIARLDVGASILTQWATPNAPDIYLSPVDPPYFTSFAPAVDQLIPTVAGFDTPAPPNPFSLYSDFLDASLAATIIPTGTIAPPVINSVLINTMPPAFNVWSPTSSSGPLTIDLFGAVWISETPVAKIATFHP